MDKNGPLSVEMNFDGLIGSTHNYGGLSYGNLASMHHQSLVSNPKEAALQGIAKMRLLYKLGIPQGVFPPHERPYLPLLYAIGYRGTPTEVIQQVWKESPQLLISSCSAASMWTANAATVTPSTDSEDGLVHVTPANLVSKFHRSFESQMTGDILRKIFSDPRYFCHHPPLPPSEDFADEGAANHVRLDGIHLFIFGRYAFSKQQGPTKFPARQTYEASKAIARLHRIPDDRSIFIQQNPEVIDVGVFHNDVISVGNENLFLTHEKAFIDTSKVTALLKTKIKNLTVIEVLSEQISVDEAVATYLFNSQLVTLSPGSMALIAPIECQQSNKVNSFLNDILQRNDNPITQIHYVNLRESMQNGGGPACLRLRVVLNDNELKSVLPSVVFTPELDRQLVQWVNTHYRDRLKPEDLADPQMHIESQKALDELTQLLKLGSLYSFQN